MSAPITEAHRKLRETLEIRWMRATESEIEQLIADSEARTCDQLRARCDQLITSSELIDLAFLEQSARAERAEASLHALRLVCGTTDADKFSTWVDRANARAERAEAELAAERAIVSRIWVQLGSPTYAQLKGRSIYCLIDEMKAELAVERARLDSGTILLTFAGERVWHCGVDLRAAIDAAMKEGAK